MRPLVLGDLFLAIVIERMFALRGGDARGLLWMPLLFALWANVHPSWPMGIAILWMHAITLAWLAPIASRIGLVVEPLAEERAPTARDSPRFGSPLAADPARGPTESTARSLSVRARDRSRRIA